MKDATVLLTLNRENLELDILAPDLSLDVVISLMERARRALENQEKILVAHQVSQSVREAAANQQHAERVLSRVKLQ